MADKKFEKAKKKLLSLVSGIALITLGWLVFFGRAKAIRFISPWIKKIPKDEGKLTEMTEGVLGKAVEVVNKQNLEKATQQGSEFFETSQYAEPARGIRDNIIERVTEVIESVKELPAQEVEVIKRQVCKSWFEEMATPSGSQQ